MNRYINALISAKIIMSCDRFDMKSRKTVMGEKKYYLSDLSFYYALSTDNTLKIGPVLENIVCTYAAGLDYTIYFGRIKKLECDFILNNKMDYSYVQVARKLCNNKDTEDKEYRPLEQAVWDNYRKYILTTDGELLKRNGIIHANLADFIIKGRRF